MAQLRDRRKQKIDYRMGARRLGPIPLPSNDLRRTALYQHPDDADLVAAIEALRRHLTAGSVHG